MNIQADTIHPGRIHTAANEWAEATPNASTPRTLENDLTQAAVSIAWAMAYAEKGNRAGTVSEIRHALADLELALGRTEAT